MILGFPLFVLFISDDFTSIDKVVEAQKEKNKLVLFGTAYSNNSFSPFYKLKSVLGRRPDVIILGTSRVLQFRSRFFKDTASFYNAGGGVSKIKHLQHFLEKVPRGEEPRLVIVGLDQYFFNSKWDYLADDDIEKRLATIDVSALDIFLNSWKKIYVDYYEKKYSLRSILAERGKGWIGLNALMNGNGIRNDGSFRDARFIRDPFNPKNEDYQFRNTFDRIAKQGRRFEYSEKISLEAIGVLERFLGKCQERGIYVVGFLPPYAHAVYQRMISMNKYQYLIQIAPSLKPVFDRYGFGFYDFSDLAWIGASDAETLDGFHGSEKAYLRLFTQMAESNPVLRHYAQGISYLQTTLRETKGDYDVFGDVF